MTLTFMWPSPFALFLLVGTGRNHVSNKRENGKGSGYIILEDDDSSVLAHMSSGHTVAKAPKKPEDKIDDKKSKSAIQRSWCWLVYVLVTACWLAVWMLASVKSRIHNWWYFVLFYKSMLVLLMYFGFIFWMFFIFVLINKSGLIAAVLTRSSSKADFIKFC
jgi:hypothetical protein